MSIKPLGRLKELVESAGMEVSYAYEDLVFLDHNAFLLQFNDDGRTVFLHTNSEADAEKISPDPKDAAYIALALKFSCGVWSNDKKLKEQNKVKVYSTGEIMKTIKYR